MEKILLVEDEARIRNIVLDYFTAHGLGAMFDCPGGGLSSHPSQQCGV